ncbi:MAG: DUF2141 domain-containing protein [Betaproteobacteria bacterium]
MKTSATAVFALIFASAALAQPAASSAAELVVRVTVTGPKAAAGRVGCSLFTAAKGFPLDISGAQTQWHPASGAAAICRFTDLADGTYALAVGQDLNGNSKVDTNVFGAPTEPWGVSNNVRHTLRPPKFEEAAFRVADGRDVQREVRVEP